ncbi:MAG: hypothetical protein P1V97_02730 [Planctomycetota bacterium]|nr:hypothetical protein [Planctomycetota bacterium]
MWTDEVIQGNPEYGHLQPLNMEEISCMRYIFNYRTHLTLAEPPLKHEPYWLEAKRHFPNWIGFHESRSTLTQKFRDCYEEHHPSHPKIVEAHCPLCKTQLRSNKAKQCLTCGAAWHSDTVINEVYDWSNTRIPDLDARLSVNQRDSPNEGQRDDFKALWHLLKWDFMEESDQEFTEAHNSAKSSIPQRIGRALLILFLTYFAIGMLYSAWDTARQVFKF